MKRGRLIVFGIIFMLSLSLISAGFFSVGLGNYSKVYANDTLGNLNAYDFSDLTINVTTPANAAPSIDWVQVVSAQDPTIGSTKSITFNFTATDTDGSANIDTGTAKAYFQKAGETTRSNTSCVDWASAGKKAGETTRSNTSCVDWASAGNDVNFTCTIDMWYFDQNGEWTINVTIKDINNAYGENSTTTFTYNLQTAMVMSPTSLTWPQVGLTDTDTGSNNDPITINNSGNDEPLNINVTAYNLQGETTTYRGNNSLNYNNATSGQEQIYFCLKGIPQDISSQSYSSSAYGSWTVAIIT